MKRTIINIFICSILCLWTIPSQAITRERLIQYAASLKGKKKADLKTAIYKISQPKKVLAYGSGEGKTWSGFYKTDRLAETKECINRYSEKKFYFSSTTAAISGMNIEHSFPKSWWGGKTNNAYKDLFNLYPSENQANSSKSNYPMGKVTNPNILDDYEKVGTGPAGSLGNIRVCEPNDIWKGDFCRSYFYMATTYQNLTWQGTQGLQQLENNTWPTLRQWAYELYLKWTRADKVLDVEVVRNDNIYSIQGNRNLYIDFPNLAEYVWGDSIDVEFDPYTSLTTATDDDRYGKYTVPETEDPGDDDDDTDIDLAAEFLFKETFDNYAFAGGNDGLWNGGITFGSIADSKNDESGWTFVKSYSANKCIKVGTANEVGAAITRSISGLDGCSFKLYFRAGCWNGNSESNTLCISATNCTLSQNSVTTVKSQWTDYCIEVTDVTGPVQFSFYGVGTNNRFFLDNILIPTEDVSSPDDTFISGDVNNDGQVTIEDLVMLIDMLNHGADVTTSPAADLNEDEIIDIQDVNCLVEILLNK